MIKKYRAAEKIRPSTPEREIREIFPTLASLVVFANEVGGLTWPGSYGESPWERAFSIAHIARGGTVTNPFVIASDDHHIAMNYRVEAGLDTRGPLGPATIAKAKGGAA